MTDEERENRNDGHTTAMQEFANWYDREYKVIKENNKDSRC